MKFPICTPPMLLQTKTYNERDLMYNNTGKFLENILSNQKYSHIVMPDYFLNKTQAVLSKNGYKKYKEIYHSLFEETNDGFAYNVNFIIFEKQN